MKKAVLILLFAIVSYGETIDFQSLADKAKARYFEFKKFTQDLTISQQIIASLNEKELSSEIAFFKKGKKWRVEQIVVLKPQEKEKKIVFIFDGKDVWMTTEEGQRKLSKDDEAHLQDFMVNWWELIKEGVIIGEEKVDDYECYIIKPNEKTSLIKRMWIDKKDYILIKVWGKEQNKDLIWYYSAFKDIGYGWIFPYKTEFYVNDKLISTTLVKSIETNKKLEDEIFVAKRENLPSLFDLLGEKILKKGGD